MGQKTNSNLLRLGYKYKTNNWDSKYCIKNKNEVSLFLFQDLEIKRFVYRFFKQYNIIIHKCEVNRSQTLLKLFISYYLSKSNLQNCDINELESIDKKNAINLSFTENFIESLEIFTKSKFNIVVILKNISDTVFFKVNINIRNYLFKLRKFLNKPFLKEFFNDLFIVLKKKKSAKFLSELILYKFITMKKHNLFLNFLKRSLLLLINSKLSNVEGIKIVIKGRLNGKLRSNSKIIQIGKIPLQKMDSQIDFFESTAFTIYGTFGIKVWICETS